MSTQEEGRFGKSDLVGCLSLKFLFSVTQTHTFPLPFILSVPGLSLEPSDALDFSLLLSSLLRCFSFLRRAGITILGCSRHFSSLAFLHLAKLVWVSYTPIWAPGALQVVAGHPAPPLSLAWSPESAPSLPKPNQTWGRSRNSQYLKAYSQVRAPIHFTFFLISTPWTLSLCSPHHVCICLLHLSSFLKPTSAALWHKFFAFCLSWLFTFLSWVVFRKL